MERLLLLSSGLVARRADHDAAATVGGAAQAWHGLGSERRRLRSVHARGLGLPIFVFGRVGQPLHGLRPAESLLNHVGELVTEQKLAVGASRRVMVGADENVISSGERARSELLGLVIGGRITVDADIAEIVTEAGLEALAQRSG